MSYDEKTRHLLKLCASENTEEALKAQRAFALAIGEPIRKGLLDDSILGNIYDRIVLEPGAESRFPLDFLSQSDEPTIIAFTIPKSGKFPTKHYEGDELWVPTFRVGNAISVDLRFIRDARYDVVARALEVLEAGFVKKNNQDGWSPILTAAADRQSTTLTLGSSAEFTKELLSKMDTYQIRNQGGNASRSSLTDLYIAPEGLEDIRGWSADGSGKWQIDLVTMKEILESGGLITLYGKRIHTLEELGSAGSIQSFYTDAGGTITGADDSLVVGLDLRNRDAFVNPVREELEIFEDAMLHRHQKMGWYGWLEHGYGVLDERRVVVGSFKE